MRGFNYKKAVQALNFIAVACGGESTNKMKAIKLVWLADRLHLRKFGRTITGDIYFALPHGPVPSTTKDILTKNSWTLSDDEFAYIDEYITLSGNYDYSSVKHPNNKVFSSSDIECIEEIVRHFGQYDHFTLRDISHNYPEWKRWEQKLQKTRSRFQMEYEDFFNDPDNNPGIFQADKEELELVKALFFRTEIPKDNALQ